MRLSAKTVKEDQSMSLRIVVVAMWTESGGPWALIQCALDIFVHQMLQMTHLWNANPVKLQETILHEDDHGRKLTAITRPFSVLTCLQDICMKAMKSLQLFIGVYEKVEHRRPSSGVSNCLIQKWKLLSTKSCTRYGSGTLV